MRIDQFIANVKEQLGVSTDDTRIRNRYVFSTGKSVRSELIRQEGNKDYLWNGGSAQVYFGFELLESTLSESAEFKAATQIYKSSLKLPKLIDTKYGKIILNVFFDNGDRLEPTEYTDWIAVRKRRYVLPVPGYFMLRNERLYVLDYQGGPDIQLNVEAIYEDPEEISLAQCDNINTYMGELDFNIPGYLERRIIEMTAIIVGKKYGIPVDQKNNGKEDLQPVQMQKQ